MALPLFSSSVQIKHQKSIKTNNMELKGTIKVVLPINEGTSSSGNAWKSQQFVIDYNAGRDKEGNDITKQAVFNGFGKIVEVIEHLGEGDDVTVHFNMNAREYKGKWYPDNQVWKIDRQEDAKQPARQEYAPVKSEPILSASYMDDEDDHLPF